MIGFLADFTHATTGQITITQDVVITPVNLTPGVPHRLIFIQESEDRVVTSGETRIVTVTSETRVVTAGTAGGHSVTIAGVEWAGGESVYTTTAGTKTVIDLLLVQGTIYASMWGTGFAPGSISITPEVNRDVVVTSFAPDVLGDLEPGVGTMTILTFTPRALAPHLAPATPALTVTTFTPLAFQAVAPAQAEITLTGFVPGIPILWFPPTGAITLTTFVPTVFPAQAIPPEASIDMTTFAPLVTIT